MGSKYLLRKETQQRQDSQPTQPTPTRKEILQEAFANASRAETGDLCNKKVK